MTNEEMKHALELCELREQGILDELAQAQRERDELRAKLLASEAKLKEANLKISQLDAFIHRHG